MQQPLFALLIAPNDNVRNAILNGTINTTIRQGHRNYQHGPVMLCCHLEPWAIMANIVSVAHVRLDQVAEKEWRRAGYQLHDLELLYPDLDKDSPVTVIQWNNISGALVEEVRRIALLRLHYPQDCQCAAYPNLRANDCHVHEEYPRHFIDGDDLDCDCHTWKNIKVTCDNCQEQAVWVRRTQFSGDHFFCDKDAKTEKDFGQEDSDYFYWIKLD